jgi:CRISPR-associated protein Csb1
MTALLYKNLKDAVSGSAAALRLTLRLEAVSPKVFPPTYEGGKYAEEHRYISGYKYTDPETGREGPVPCVLLDSVPSQANRMEFALQDAWSGGELQLPVVSVNFEKVENPGLSKITSLQAPHRIVDAILRDSTLGNVAASPKFRDSDIGKQLDLLSAGYATPLLTYSPHCLVFGIWDSTGPRGGLGVKFARAIVSEIIGVNAVKGVKTSSRMDPLNIKIEAGPVYRSVDGGWTLDEAEALKEKGKAVKFKNKIDGDAKKEGKPSSINHGNIKPVISVGGFTIDYAEQTTVLSLPALRRLRFPAKSGEKSVPEVDAAARTYLAAIGLLGATLAVESGNDLRSRCILRSAHAMTWQLLGKPGDPDESFSLDKAAALALYKDALAAVEKVLPIHLDEIELTPEKKLIRLVVESMKIAAMEPGEGE